MAIVQHPPYKPIVDDPDDFRPNSEYVLLADRSSERTPVEDLVTILERLAPGDRVPLHVHPVSELITLHRGQVEITLADENRAIIAPASVFIPAGTPHGYVNIGPDYAELQAVFPSSKIGIEYIERNPAPGTETEAPSSYIYDVFAETVTMVARGSEGLTSE